MVRRMPPSGLALPGQDPIRPLDSSAAALNMPPRIELTNPSAPAKPPAHFPDSASANPTAHQNDSLRTPLVPPPAPSSSWQPLTSSANGAEPDYFATIPVPNPGAPDGSAGVRIASPFSLPGGAGGQAAPMAADSQQQLQEQPHPWAALFGDGGIKTALPEGAASSSILTIPPTPAANPNSVPKKAFSGLPSNLPGISASTLSLPAMKGFKLNGGLSSRPTTKSNTASASSSRPTSAEDLSRFKPLQIGQFVEALSNPDWARNAKVAEQHCRPDVLVLDIRPSTSFAAARVCSSINICAPSTLLKRPGVTVERIEQDMLCNNRDRKRFLQWRNGPKKSANTSPDESSPSPKRGATACDAGDFGFKSIIVLDTDTARVSDMGNPTAGGGGPCLIGMLKKFDAAGYAGDLCWLVGGFNKLTSSKEAEALIENKPLSDANHESDDEATDSTGLPGSAAALTPDGRTTSPALAQKLKLPPSGSPFEIGSTSGRKGSLVQPRGLPMEAFQAQSTIAGWPGQAQANRSVNQEQAPAAPQFNLDNRNAGAEQSACANPFFDNIRQNRELAHGITETIPMELPHMSQPQIEALPPFLQKLVGMSGHERAISLAQSFFDVEKAEQNRLIATMQQHSQQSCEDPRKLASTLAGGQGGVSSFSSVDPAAATKLASSLPALGNSDKGQHFPFSIAAALERGADNRYNNIWTYEHSRVKLSKPKDSQDPGSDYLNGSFVHPMQHYGSKRRYIATQAPLPTTFEAFWTAVWEQNSRVIVMLTREHESGRIQSHPYWNQSEFGPNIRVDKLEEVVMNDDGEIMRGPECDGILRGNANAPELFPSMGSAGGGSASCSTPATIRRLFRLRNLAEPSASPRRIVQLQYIAWPDYHIPDTPDSLLTLMDMADAAQNDADAELRQIATSSGRSSSLREAYAGPMVVHCSAGVGRTGAFIVIDSTLDVLRRCRRRKRQLAGLSPWDNHGESARSPSHIDVEMPALSPSRTRTPRRSLKRELSPTRMDIDGSSDSQHGRELSSPPPMLRTRSHEGNRDTLDLGSWPSSSSSSVGTPSRAFGSLQIASSASPSFVNPFNSTRTLATPLAAGGGGGGSSGEEASMVTVPGSEHADTVKGPSKLLFGTPTRGSEHYRSGSSPFSEASSLSLPPSSARSSFSAASISEAPHGLLRTASSASQASQASQGSLGAAGSVRSSRSIESLGSTTEALNPFDAALCLNGEAEAEAHSSGSNEPTPFPRQNAGAVPNSTGINADADEAYACGDDLIRKAAFTAREQRMSLIQTCRQFVFVYSAVLAGFLRELRQDGIE